MLPHKTMDRNHLIVQPLTTPSLWVLAVRYKGRNSGKGNHRITGKSPLSAAVTNFINRITPPYNRFPFLFKFSLIFIFIISDLFLPLISFCNFFFWVELGDKDFPFLDMFPNTGTFTGLFFSVSHSLSPMICSDQCSDVHWPL